jgi:hypothetical protein
MVPCEAKLKVQSVYKIAEIVATEKVLSMVEVLAKALGLYESFHVLVHTNNFNILMVPIVTL